MTRRFEVASRWDPASLTLTRAAMWDLKREGISRIDIAPSLVLRGLEANDHLSAAAIRQKMPGVLFNVAQDLRPSGGVGKAISKDHSGLQLRGLRHAAAAARAQSILTHAGSPPLVVKGMALAVLSGGDFTSRGVGDVDLLVAPHQLDDAVSALVAQGAAVRAGKIALRSQGSTGHPYAHAVTCTFDGVDLDIHSRLDHMPGVLGVPFEELWRGRQLVRVAGVELHTLGDCETTLLVAVNAGRDAWSTIGSVVDFVRLFASLEARDQVGTLWHLADRYGARGRLQVAIEMSRPFRPDLPNTSAVARTLARQAWRWLAAGQSLRHGQSPGEVMQMNAFRVLSAGTWAGFYWWLGRTSNLPSDAEQRPLGNAPHWVYSAVSPYLAIRRLEQRRQGGRKPAG